MAALRSKRCLLQEGQLTTRKKARCPVIKENEAKIRIPLCGVGGGGTRWRPKPSSPLPKARIQDCTALPRAEFFIEPPPDTQRKRRRGEREKGVTRGSYLLLTSLSPLPPPSSPTPRACCIAWGCVIRTYPPPIVHPHGQKSVIFRKSG
jgi:hypothetical protein